MPMMPFFFPPPGSFGTTTPSPSPFTPQTPQSADPPGFLARLGLRDPRVAGLIASQIFSAPSLGQALGAIGQGPALLAQFQEEEDKRRREQELWKRQEEDRKRAESDRQHRIQLLDAEEKRRIAAEADRVKDRGKKDDLFAQQEERQKAYLQEVSAAEVAGKIGPGLARTLRLLDVEEGSPQLLGRLYKTNEQKLREESARLGLENTQSLIEDRKRRASEPADPRIRRRELLMTIGRQIDDLRAMKPDEIMDPRAYSAWESSMSTLMAQQESLKRDQESELGGTQPAPSVPREKIIADLAALPGMDVTRARAGVIQWEQEGIYDAVVALLQQGVDLRTALQRARAKRP